MSTRQHHFMCPHCKGHLNLGGYVVFSVKTQDGERGLVLSSPVLGEYTKISHPEFDFEENERLEFYCPVCHAGLGARDVHENLAKIVMKAVKNDLHDVFFSTITGERCSYKVSQDKVYSFGDDAHRYLDVFDQVGLVR